MNEIKAKMEQAKQDYRMRQKAQLREQMSKMSNEEKIDFLLEYIVALDSRIEYDR